VAVVSASVARAVTVALSFIAGMERSTAAPAVEVTPPAALSKRWVVGYGVVRRGGRRNVVVVMAMGRNEEWRW